MEKNIFSGINNQQFNNQQKNREVKYIPNYDEE